MATRVLHIVTYMGRGGLETMLMNYYRHIDRNKVQFDFLVHRDFEADYDEEIKSLGGKIYHVSHLVPWSKKYKNELKNFLLKHPEYKVIHVHQDCLSSIALKCARDCGIPIRIAHSHSAGAVKNIKYPIKRYYMKKIPKYATDLFACGEQAGEWMFGNNNYRVVHNAIDTSSYLYSEAIEIEMRKELGLGNEIIIGHVGNFTPAKNHSFLIDIFYEVLKQKIDAKLLLVGGGDAITAIQEKVQSLGISESVIFTGNRNDVCRLMQVMDVFVFPSLYEGLPVTMIEAQTAGIPCVISDHVSKECVVTEGLVSIMRLENSSKAWADHILSISSKKIQIILRK